MLTDETIWCEHMEISEFKTPEKNFFCYILKYIIIRNNKFYLTVG